MNIDTFPESSPASTGRLTVAIPFYSRLDFMKRAITSVLRQSSPDWELLVCDDSTPRLGAKDIVDAFRDDRIRYLRNPNRLGMARNWNRCLDMARTDLVTILHGDDELLPGYCEQMIVADARHPNAVAFFCRATTIDEDSRPSFSLPEFVKSLIQPVPRKLCILAGERGLRSLLRGNFIMCPTLCYRRKTLGDRRFAEEWKMVQDLELTTRLLLAGEVLIGIPEIAFAYRRHQENATIQYTQSLLRFHEEVALYDRLAEETAKRNWLDANASARRKAIIKLNLAFCAFQDLVRLRLRGGGEKLAYLARLLFSA